MTFSDSENRAGLYAQSDCRGWWQGEDLHLFTWEVTRSRQVETGVCRTSLSVIVWRHTQLHRLLKWHYHTCVFEVLMILQEAEGFRVKL
jgi:hypothetical protein